MPSPISQSLSCAMFYFQDFGAHVADPFAASSPVALEVMNILKLFIQMHPIPAEVECTRYQHMVCKLPHSPTSLFPSAASAKVPSMLCLPNKSPAAE